jgi:membrane protease YdiL (CAAX protease family)
MTTTQNQLARPTDLPSRALVYFALITFAITWGIGGSYIFLPEATATLFGELDGPHPLYFIATWGPGIAGVILVYSFGGGGGLKAFFSRLRLWRATSLWWLLLLVGIPLAFVAGSLIKGGPVLAPMEDGVVTALVLAIIMLLLGPIEEFGWRGVALPILQRHIAPIWAAALIGLVWGVWHLPAFYLSGTVYADWNFPLFLVGCVTLSILVTQLFNDARGSLFLPIIFHWQLIMPFWPDAQPWDTWILMVVTAVVVWAKRDMMFSAQGAVTRVIPARD